VVRPKFTTGKDEDDMTAEEVRKIAGEVVAEAIAKAFPVYHTVDDIPAWYVSAMKKLMDKGGLQGDGQGNINASDDMCRTFTALDRIGKLD